MLKRFDVWLQQLEFTKSMYGLGLAVAGILLLLASVLAPVTQALSIDSARDCDENAVIRCGATTITELKEKYYATGDVATIFSHFGITTRDIRNIHNSNTVEGSVTQGGRVIVDGKTVATDAITAGRQDMSGSQAMTKDGSQFYVRTPSASFQSSSLKAFVVMDKDNQFLFAVIASCGNPVKATPVKPDTPPVTTSEKEAPAPPPIPPTATPPEPTVINNTNTNINNNTSSSASSASVTIQQPATPTKVEQPPAPVTQTVVRQVEVPAPVTTETVATAKELPKTGTESVSTTLSIAGVAMLVGTVGHFALTKRRLLKN